jgi:hypothetical protein
MKHVAILPGGEYNDVCSYLGTILELESMRCELFDQAIILEFYFAIDDHLAGADVCYGRLLSVRIKENRRRLTKVISSRTSQG